MWLQLNMDIPYTIWNFQQLSMFSRKFSKILVIFSYKERVSVMEDLIILIVFFVKTPDLILIKNITGHNRGFHLKTK